MKYQKATEKLDFYQPRIIETNCTDRVNGHSYRWVSDKIEVEEIIKEHPSFRGIGIALCTKCGKVQSSH